MREWPETGDTIDIIRSGKILGSVWFNVLRVANFVKRARDT